MQKFQTIVFSWPEEKISNISLQQDKDEKLTIEKMN